MRKLNIKSRVNTIVYDIDRYKSELEEIERSIQDDTLENDISVG